VVVLYAFVIRLTGERWGHVGGSVGTCRIAAKRPRPRAHVAMPGPLATQTRLPPVNPTRANGGAREREWWPVASTCRIAAKRLRRDAGPQATTPVNAIRANGETRGRERGQHLPDRGQAAALPRRDAGATGHNARGRDTGERWDAVAGTAWSRSLRHHLPDRGQAADDTSAAIVGLLPPTPLTHHSLDSPFLRG
jgi:hypothetical protein